ncbi:MAG: EF-P lysine aminoacylase GenX [Pirellulales bacterium]|nr:EF-P lysine aminoacylase GenX [Pirellulales bacterium]
MSEAIDPHAWRPTASLENLARRAALLRRVREFFHTRGFLEVETPILSHDIVVDRHLDPFATRWTPETTRPEIGETLWLQTSPEFGMKRLLAAGAGPIYQITRAFRNGEAGPLHNAEFTILEWYRPGDNLAAGMSLLSDVAECLFARGPADRLSYAEAFQCELGLDPHRAEATELKAACERAGVAVPASLAPDDRDGWLDLLVSECIQPKLGLARPTILYDYPASQSALARVRHEEPPVAERFELFVDGVELANGYHELTNAAELRARNTRANIARHSDGKQTLPEESRLLDAMEAGLSDCAGVALGFDRALMLAVGAKSIDEVIAFPRERA